VIRQIRIRRGSGIQQRKSVKRCKMLSEQRKLSIKGHVGIVEELSEAGCVLYGTLTLLNARSCGAVKRE
jgi:hypothetical protein